MYTEFFGLRERPFAQVPDPRFLYLGGLHREVLAQLLTGLEDGEGWLAVVGGFGAGKTTVACALRDRMERTAHVALLVGPVSDPRTMLDTIARELDVPPARGRGADPLAVLCACLIERRREQRRSVLVLDQAHELSRDGLALLVALSELELDGAPLLQIVVLGEPRLRELLARAAPRSPVVVHALLGLGPREAEDYVLQRLRVAGWRSSSAPFTRTALRALARESGGLPRALNALADLSLLLGFGARRTRIGVRLVRAAAVELRGRSGARSLSARWLALAAAGVAASLALFCGRSWLAAEELANRHRSVAPTVSSRAGGAPRAAAQDALPTGEVALPAR